MVEKYFDRREKNIDPGGSERTSEIATFSKEQKKGLARLGYKYFYPLPRQTMADLREEGNRFWGTWYKDEFEKALSMGAEIALNPRALFLARSNNKTLSQQESMISRFSKELGKEVPGVIAVMGEAPDYSGLAFAHKTATGVRLFGPGYDYGYARTNTPTSVSHVAIVGAFINDLGVVQLHRDYGLAKVWAVPLVVPKAARLMG